MRQMSPGTRPASAQVPQLMVVPRVSLARSTASGLAAMAVMNMAEEMVDVWKQVFIRYAPSFFSVPFACAHGGRILQKISRQVMMHRGASVLLSQFPLLRAWQGKGKKKMNFYQVMMHLTASYSFY